MTGKLTDEQKEKRSKSTLGDYISNDEKKAQKKIIDEIFLNLTHYEEEKIRLRNELEIVEEGIVKNRELFNKLFGEKVKRLVSVLCQLHCQYFSGYYVITGNRFLEKRNLFQFKSKVTLKLKLNEVLRKMYKIDVKYYYDLKRIQDVELKFIITLNKESFWKLNRHELIESYVPQKHKMEKIIEGCYEESDKIYKSINPMIKFLFPLDHYRKKKAEKYLDIASSIERFVFSLDNYIDAIKKEENSSGYFEMEEK